jgi:radical SAM superfamily enzyme YgiQ (UPF0313 family)
MAHVLFVQTEWFEHLGIASLAAFIRERGHTASLLISRRADEAIERIVEASPDVAALSATTGAHRAALDIARGLRPYFKGRIIMGGPHPTFFPEVVFEPGLDAVCRGEGEVPLAEALARIDAGESWEGVPGLWVKQDGEIIKNSPPDLIVDLDSLPFPARDLMEAADPMLRRSSMRRVMAGRGCPYKCSYCFNQAMQELVKGKGPYVRLRGVDHVMAELKALAARGAKTINFVDDTFGLKRGWALELLDRYKSEVSLPFIVNLRPEQADSELVSALARAGCYCAQMGVESANGDTRREALLREVGDEVIEQAARRIKEADIRLLTYNMVGLPGEGLDDAVRTLELNSRLGVDFPRVSIFQPYPRTSLGDRVLSGLSGKGETGGKSVDFDSMSESYFRRSPLAGPEARRIENLHKLFLPFLKLGRLRPLIIALSRLPANPVFDLVFLVSMGLQYRRATNRGLRETLRLGLRNLGAYFS